MSSHSTYIIAEIGVNHNGDMALADKLIAGAAHAGADAVKFQTFKADKLVTKTAEKAEYQKAQTGNEQSQYEMLKALELSESDHFHLHETCQRKKIDFISTPFDLDSVSFLAGEVGVKRLKIGSGDLTNAPLLYKAAQTGLPIILSSGMADLADIEEALGVICLGIDKNPTQNPRIEDFQRAWANPDLRQKLQQQVTLLHCTSNYPALAEEANLSALPLLHQAFGLKIGFSDHTEGSWAAIASIALGAKIIEKHITLDRDLPGPDHKASIDIPTFEMLVKDIRQTEKALGHGYKIPSASERTTAKVARKSLIALKPIKAGELFTEDNLGLKRPGGGTRPIYFWSLLGQKAKRDYSAEELI